MSTDDTSEAIVLHHIEAAVCELCITGAGGECHVPGCSFWMHDALTGDALAWVRGRRDLAVLLADDDTRPTAAELRAALVAVRRGMPSDATTVICGDDIEVTHRSKDADGTYRVTTKRKEST